MLAMSDEYCKANEPLVRRIKPLIAEYRATVCVVRGQSVNSSSILREHACRHDTQVEGGFFCDQLS